MRGHDQRQFYRVRLDAELERGVVDAWERYQNAAALALRESEEWELDRQYAPRQAAPGENVNAASLVTYQAVAMRGGWEAARPFIDREFVALERQLLEVGCLRASLVRATPTHSPTSAGYRLVVYGVGANAEQRRFQNFQAGIGRDNAEAAAIAGAHLAVGERVSERSWRYCARLYEAQPMRTTVQLSAALADLVAHPKAATFREAAFRERVTILGYANRVNDIRTLYGPLPHLSGRW